MLYALKEQSRRKKGKRRISGCWRKRAESQIKDEVKRCPALGPLRSAYRTNRATPQSHPHSRVPCKKYKTCDPTRSCRSPRNRHTFLPTLGEYERTNCVRRERQQNVKYATRSRPRLRPVISRPLTLATAFTGNPRGIPI